MQTSSEAKYLGALITEHGYPAQEIRLNASFETSGHLLDKRNCGKKWKLLVGSLQLSHYLSHRGRGAPSDFLFHLNGIRKVHKFHTTFIDTNNTNDFVYSRANEVRSPRHKAHQGPLRKIKPLPEILT